MNICNKMIKSKWNVSITPHQNVNEINTLPKNILILIKSIFCSVWKFSTSSRQNLHIPAAEDPEVSKDCEPHWQRVGKALRWQRQTPNPAMLSLWALKCKQFKANSFVFKVQPLSFHVFLECAEIKQNKTRQRGNSQPQMTLVKCQNWKQLWFAYQPLKHKHTHKHTHRPRFSSLLRPLCKQYKVALNQPEIPAENFPCTEEIYTSARYLPHPCVKGEKATYQGLG